MLANATDADGDPLMITILSAPADAKQRASAERQVEFLKGHTVNLEQRWTALKARVDEILKKSKAAAG